MRPTATPRGLAFRVSVVWACPKKPGIISFHGFITNLATGPTWKISKNSRIDSMILICQKARTRTGCTNSLFRRTISLPQWRIFLRSGVADSNGG